MNYQLRLVRGPGAAFFLEEWAPGGVEITPEAVGLFEAHKDRSRLAEQLETFGLEPVSFSLVQLVKVGLAPTWTWRSVRWASDSPALAEAVRRIESLLGPEIRAARERQIQLLKLLQAVSRREGAPVRLEGAYARPGGRVELIYVYASGVVAYDRTPHPIAFLCDVVGALEPPS